MVMSNDVGHFGLSHGTVTRNTVKLVTSKPVKYNILVMADRADEAAADFKDIVDEVPKDPE